jgi:DNA-binding transcriptional regulator YiaG
MGKIITDEEVGHMAKRHAAGVSCALIAKDMDCAESTVRRNLDKLKDGYTKAKGETKRNAKLNEKKVRAIRKAKDVTQNVLAERYGISKSTVQAVLNHETWRHIK